MGKEKNSRSSKYKEKNENKFGSFIFYYYLCYHKQVKQISVMKNLIRLAELCLNFGTKRILNASVTHDGKQYTAPRLEGNAMCGTLVCTEITANGAMGNNFLVNDALAEKFLETLITRKFIIHSLETLVHKRTNPQMLKSLLLMLFGEECNVVDVSLDEEEISLDFHCIFANKYGDFDIWYLPMLRCGGNGENIYITEVGWEFDSTVI